MTRWLDPHPVDAEPLATLNLPLLIAQTLLRRGILTPDSARTFLHPEAAPSVQFPNIEKATDIILNAIDKNDMICVWGDFDVDGQTSTTLLVQTLRALDANVIHYIPIRGKESHGVHIETLQPIIEKGVKLIVTCDTGITAHEAIDYANSCGVDVIVTDHHELGETLPSAKAIVNPKLLPADHPLRNLAGVGVAYKLAEALLDIRYSGIGNRESATDSQITTPDSLLDLVALGLIADVALLHGETRSLAQKGIQMLRGTKRLGLKVMAELSNTNLETLTEDTIGFSFAPRLNALGRLSDANPAVDLLLTQDSARARVLAAQIEGLNAQRRLLTSQVCEAAENQLRANPKLLMDPAIVLSHPNWPGGVVGIVANRLVDRYHKPALLLTESEDGILRGSARSIEGLHITEAIATQKDLLLGFGGHPMAAGVSLLKENFSTFRKGLGKAIEKQLGEIIREEPTLQIDAWLGFEEINLELAKAIELLAPFGAGNPELILATRGVVLKSVTEIGKTKEHVRLTLEDEDGQSQNILWWNGAGEELPSTGSKFDIAYRVRATSFRGQSQVALTFEEFRVTKESAIEVRPAIEIIDYRSAVEKFEGLNILTFAEGKDKAKGMDRYHLYQADEFALYSTPPSATELHNMLEIVKPKKIYVFGVAPKFENTTLPKITDEFLTRLAGMTKYAINNKTGKVSIQELASAIAQRESAIQIGLEWLAAGGHVAIKGESDALTLSAEDGKTNQYLQKELYVAIRGILQETVAYREYFSRANLEAVMGLLSA